MALPYPATVLSHATGLSGGNSARLVAELRSEGLLDPGKKFGGQNWSLSGIRNYMLAASIALSPKQAAKATTAYIGSTYKGSPGTREQQSYLGPGTAGDVLNRVIEVGARHAAAAEDRTIEELFARSLHDPALRTVHYVDLCLNPLRIEFVWYSPGGGWARSDVFAPENEPVDDLPSSGVVTRKATIPWALFVTAGRVWLETSLRRGVALPASVSPSAPASVENGNAEGSPARDTSARTRTNDRSRLRETGTLASPDFRRVCANLQASQDSRIGHFPLSTGDGQDARTFRDPPPPC